MATTIYDAGTPGYNNGQSNPGGPIALRGLGNAVFTVADPRVRDVSGRQKVTQHQNIYDADFEYGGQPLRWENFLNPPTPGPSITQLPGLGGIQMQVTTASGDTVIRQSRPYHRYQPGKALYMASNVNFGGPLAGQYQRVGIFDDSNGIFFEQFGAGTTTNPASMFVVVRSDAQGSSGGVPVDTRIALPQWNGDQALIRTLDWTRVQMIWMEYAWYGAGALRFGVLLNGEPYILHQIGVGNGTYTGTGQQGPWSRTGNLPVRYEMRNISATSATTFRHYGVSVLVEGMTDDQRGFTYSYGMAPASPRRAVPANSLRYPVLSYRMRTMGFVNQDQSATNGAVLGTSNTTTLNTTGAAFTASAYVGRYLYYQPTVGGTITSVTQQSTSAMTASITGTVMTVTAVTGTLTGTGVNALYPGMSLTGATAGTLIVSQLTSTAAGGALGSTGTYLVNISQSSPTVTLAAGAVAVIVFGSNHNLRAQGTPTTTTGDVVTLSNFTTTAANGTYPVLATPTATQALIGLGYGVVPGAITVGSGTVTAPYTARITANSTTQLTIADVVTGGALPNAPTANCLYQIGLIDRGQLLPQTMLISADQPCIVELIASTPTAQVGLNGATFQSLSSLGAVYSFAERDVSSVGIYGGEVVYAFTAPAGGSGLLTLDLSNFFPALNTIKGNIPDIVSVVVTTTTAANVGVNVICQEAMS